MDKRFSIIIPTRNRSSLLSATLQSVANAIRCHDPVEVIVVDNGSTIRFIDDGKLRLMRHAYLPSNDPVQKLKILGTDTSQLLETIEHNLVAREQDLRFQRKASNVRIKREAIPEFKQYLRRKGQAFLEEVDLYLSRHEAKDDSAAELSVAVFYHESDGGDEREKEERNEND